ncbi:GH25 family lysozyme [Kitasatospora sp. NPDC052868]|uniref:GH25 family lysozyme n=1 Tax=Kitasatospora sp. NPDC052868 TaxID=3364060 RepID=UPI0037C951F6
MPHARGYDLSDYQSGLPADAEFVFVKASEGARTEQSGYAAKVAEARRRGIPLGHYHFLHAENPVAGEVDHFCRVVGSVPPGELLVLDFEPYGQPVSDAQATAAKNTWLTAVKARYPANRVGLYTNTDWWRRTDDNAGDFLWIADYNAQAGSPRIQAPWRFHQYADSPIDTNVYNGTADDLRAWAGSTTPTAGPAAPSAWPGLQLVTRAQWGARPWREPNGSIPYSRPRAGVKVHYLGDAYTVGDHSTCPAYVRKLQASHMDGNGWSDIGYSFVVCEHGLVFEGRGLSRLNGANGNTDLNQMHYAVCLLVGSSGSTEPTPEQLNGARDAIEYCQQRGPAGPEIRGHRDGYPTDCPGGPIYAWVQHGAPRPNTTTAPTAPAPEDDDVPFSEEDLRKIIREEVAQTVTSQPVRDSIGYAAWYQLHPELQAIPDAVWQRGLPQVDGDWRQDPAAPTVPAEWLLAGLRVALIRQAAQDAALQAITTATAGIDTAAVEAAVNQAVGRVEQAMAAGVEIHITTPTTPKETS